MFTKSETLYRQTAAEGATYIGLLLVVYDTLAGDLRRAGAAVDGNNIAVRCEASNHALLLLGHLESWTASLEEPALKDSLAQFYAYLRAQMLFHQAESQAQAFFSLASLVEQTRAVWQAKESQGTRAGELASTAQKDALQPRSNDEPVRRSSWSA